MVTDKRRMIKSKIVNSLKAVLIHLPTWLKKIPILKNYPLWKSIVFCEHFGHTHKINWDEHWLWLVLLIGKCGNSCLLNMLCYFVLCFNGYTNMYSTAWNIKKRTIVQNAIKCKFINFSRKFESNWSYWIQLIDGMKFEHSAFKSRDYRALVRSSSLI